MHSDTEVWQSRFIHYGDASRQVWLRALQLITLGLTFLITLTGLVIAQDALPILFAVPIVLLLLWAVGIRLIHESLHLAAHRDWANVMVNRRLGRSETSLESWHVVSGSSLSGYKKSRSAGLPNKALLGTLCVVSLALAVGPGTYLAFNESDWLWFGIGLSVASVAGLVILAIAANRMNLEAGEMWKSIRNGIEASSRIGE